MVPFHLIDFRNTPLKFTFFPLGGNRHLNQRNSIKYKCYQSIYYSTKTSKLQNTRVKSRLFMVFLLSGEFPPNVTSLLITPYGPFFILNTFIYVKHGFSSNTSGFHPCMLIDTSLCFGDGVFHLLCSTAVQVCYYIVVILDSSTGR